MQEVYEFLKKCGTYYLATMDGDQPRVRPFAAGHVSGGGRQYADLRPYAGDGNFFFLHGSAAHGYVLKGD